MDERGSRCRPNVPVVSPVQHDILDTAVVCRMYGETVQPDEESHLRELGEKGLQGTAAHLVLTGHKHIRELGLYLRRLLPRAENDHAQSDLMEPLNQVVPLCPRPESASL